MQNKRRKRSRQNRVTKHHLIERQVYWTNNKENVVYLPYSSHMGLHHFFWQNKPYPIDKIDRIIQLHKPCFIEWVVEEVETILNMWKKYWKDVYNPNCLKI